MSILVLILKIKNEILSIYSNVVAYSIEKKKDFQNKYNNLFKKNPNNADLCGHHKACNTNNFVGRRFSK